MKPKKVLDYEKCKTGNCLGVRVPRLEKCADCDSWKGGQK